MAHYNAERKEEKGVYCLISAKKKRGRESKSLPHQALSSVLTL
jgi:hypothetical protein